MTKTQSGRGGMGSHKHGISGYAGHSPRFKHWMKREAEKNERRRRSIIEPKASVQEVFADHKIKR